MFTEIEIKMGNISPKSLEATNQHGCEAMFSNNRQEHQVEQEQKCAGQNCTATMAAASQAFLKIE